MRRVLNGENQTIIKDPIIEVWALSTSEFAAKVGLAEHLNKYQLVGKFWNLDSHVIPGFENFRPHPHLGLDEVWLIKCRDGSGSTYVNAKYRAFDVIGVSRGF